jgi:hypothetical protein
MDGIRSQVSPENLYEDIGTASMPLVIDVRRPDDFDTADDQIADAIRRLPTEVEQWRREIPSDRRVVVYCVRGCSTSQTAGERGYSDTGGKARLAPTEYIDGRQRNHMDDYLPKGRGSG